MVRVEGNNKVGGQTSRPRGKMGHNAPEAGGEASRPARLEAGGQGPGMHR